MRFNVGDQVRIIKAMAEYYTGKVSTVVAARKGALNRLNEYELEMYGLNVSFFEFQLEHVPAETRGQLSRSLAVADSIPVCTIPYRFDAIKKQDKLVRFKRGDRVRWVRALSLPEHENAVGTVLNVIPNDAHVDAFTIYYIEFQFGTFALRGTEVEADAG
jgi:hypothetical protein